jgi:hypothetical protein
VYLLSELQALDYCKSIVFLLEDPVVVLIDFGLGQVMPPRSI